MARPTLTARAATVPLQDKRDDAKLGLRSSALTLGDARTKPALAVASALAVAGVGAAGLTAGLSPLPLGCGLAVGAAHLAWQVGCDRGGWGDGWWWLGG